MDAVINAHGLQVAYGKHVALNLEDFRIDFQAGVELVFLGQMAQEKPPYCARLLATSLNLKGACKPLAAQT